MRSRWCDSEGKDLLHGGSGGGDEIDGCGDGGRGDGGGGGGGGGDKVWWLW